MKKRMQKTAFLCISFFCLIALIYAEQLEIDVSNNYLPGDNVSIKINLYESNILIDKDISYNIQNYYTDIIEQGIIKSGDVKNFTLSTNAVRGPWKINAEYNGITSNRLFNIGELQKAEIKLGGDNLIITNIGNVPYEKPLLIYIGDKHETAKIFLEIGQVKKIKLTAPAGNYDIKISDGKKDINFEKVLLTGEVVGLSNVSYGNFWTKYPLVSLFLTTILVVVSIVFGLKIRKKLLK